MSLRRPFSLASEVDKAVDHSFKQFLPTADGLWVEVFVERMLRKRLEAEFTRQQRLSERLLPACVALVLELLKLIVLHHGRCALQRQGEHIHGGNVAVEQVDFVEALTTDLGIEIVAAIGETTGLENLDRKSVV